MTIKWQQVRVFQSALEAIHPELFSLEKPVPFRIGIGFDIRNKFPAASRMLVRRLLEWLTMRRAYLHACHEGAERHDFDGPCGEFITEKQAAYARKRFADRNAKALDKWPDQVVA